MIPLQLLKEVLLWLVMMLALFTLLSMFFGMCIIVNYFKGVVPWRKGSYGRTWVGFKPGLNEKPGGRTRSLEEMRELYGQTFEWPDR